MVLLFFIENVVFITSQNKFLVTSRLNILYNVDKLRPMVIDAYNVIEQVEREKKNQKVKKALLNKKVVQLNKREAS